jgi:solute carrier family 35 protein E1
MFATEGEKFGTFVDMLKTQSSLQYNLVMSGLCFYIYNELATYTLQVTGAVTASVANTAKRVVSLHIICRWPFSCICDSEIVAKTLLFRFAFVFQLSQTN